MGIVNVTPDSFSDGGRYLDPDAAVSHGLRLISDGAAIVDVGGESTRPGADRVPVDVEQERAIPVVAALAGAGARVSIDTMNAATAVEAVAAGAKYVNDVSGGLADPEMLSAVAGTGARYILGHWRGHSANMYANTDYGMNVARAVAAELLDRVHAAVAAGIAPDRIIVDPGIGFGKTGAQNWALLRDLSAVTQLGYRVLVGTSRKRFLTDAVGDDASQLRRDLASAVTSAMAADAGAWGVRVHDVVATRDALRIVAAWKGSSG